MSARALYEDVSSHEASEARRHLRSVQAEAGELLMEEKDLGPALVWIVEGQVEVRRGGVVIDTSGPGEVVGEMSLFTGKPRVASVVATGPVKLLVLDEDGRKALRKAGNEVLYNLERAILAQQANRIRRLAGLISERAQHGQLDPYAPQPPSLFGRLRSMVVGKQEPPPIVDRPLNAAEVLRTSPIFQQEPADALGVIAMSFERQNFRKGDFLYRQGEPGDGLFVIGQGQADLFVTAKGKPDQPRILSLGKLGPGSAAGLPSLVDDRSRSASCVACEQVDALRLDKARWKRFLKEQNTAGSAIRSGMIRALSEILSEAGAHFVKAERPDDAASETAARLEHTGTTLQ